jgi:RNA polymerase sigma-70 factor (ECF subfamily)
MATTATVPQVEWLAGVVRDLERPLVRYAFSLTRDYDRARDAVQETFLELWRNSATVDRARPAPWLFAVCRARSVDRVRKETRMRAHPTAELAERPSDVAPPDTRVLAMEASAEAARLLGLLPEREQEVVRLKFQQGLSYKEIAEVTGHSVSHVGVMIHNAIQRLRKELDAVPQGAIR